MGGACARRRGRWLAAFAAVALATGPAQSQITTTYTYDGAGRLVRAEDSNGPKVTYAYDKAGNRTQVGNGVDANEYVDQVGYSASSALSGTSAPTPGGMRDTVFDARASLAATAVQSDAWIQADLGSAKNVAMVKLAPANEPTLQLDEADINGAVLEHSVNGSTWSQPIALNSMLRGAYHRVTLAGVSARYVRVRRPGVGQVALGDLRLYSSVQDEPTTISVNPVAINVQAGGSIKFNPLQSYPGLTLQSVSVNPLHGTAALTDNGTTITYIPTPNYTGGDTFSYSVRDAQLQTGTGVVNVTVEPNGSGGGTNHPPFALQDNVRPTVGQTFVFNPLQNDADVDDDPIHLVSVSQAMVGPFVIDTPTFNATTGVVTWTPSTFWWNDEVVELSYVIADSRGAQTTGRIVATMIKPNQLPNANDDNVAVTGKPITFNPLANDTDQEPLTITGMTIPAHGTVTLNPANTMTFTPDAGYVGADSIQYTVADTRGGNATATVHFTITENVPPVANPDSISGTPGLRIDFNPRTNDTDADNDVLKIVATGPTPNGTVVITGNGTGLSYTATGGYTGTDTFTYTVSDGVATSTATVTATLAITPVTWSPTDKNASVVLSNGDLTMTSGSSYAGVRGTVGRTIGKLYFEATVPAGGKNGNGVGIGTSAASLSSHLGSDAHSWGYLVNETVQNANYPLTLTAPPYGVGDVIGVAVDLDARKLWFSKNGVWTGSPGAGTGGYALSAGVFFPIGSAHSGGAFVANFGAGAFAKAAPRGFIPWDGSDPASSNAAPVAVDDTVVVELNVAKTFDLRANDRDNDGDVFTVTEVSTPGSGTAVVDPGGLTVTYTPNPGFVGTDSFSYTVSDGAGGTATANVSVSVVPMRWNPNDKAASVTLSNGDLTLSGVGGARATLGRASGKFYYEARADGAGTRAIGIAGSASYIQSYVGNDASSYGHYSNGSTGSLYNNGNQLASYAAYGVGDVIGVAVDFGLNRAWWSKNGVWLGGGNPANGTGGIAITPRTYYPAGSGGGSGAGSPVTANFGATAFANALPRGFAAWDGVGAAAVNHPPTAVDDTVIAAPNVAKAITPQANDTDLDLDTLMVTDVSTPSNGTVTITGGGTGVSYTSAGNHIGPASFTYTVSDGAGGTATATVTVQVAVTWSPTDKNSNLSISNGNLTMTGASNSAGIGRATTGRSTGKHYFETQLSGFLAHASLGVAKSTANLGDFVGSDVNGFGWAYSGYLFNGAGNNPAFYGALALGDVYGVAVDLDAHKIWFSRNGVWQGGGDPIRNVGGLTLPAGTYFPAAGVYNGGVQAGRFTPSAMSRPVPRGFAPWDGSTGPTPNANPVAVTDPVAVDRNVAVAFDPRVNDSDVDGDTLTVTDVSGASHGTATLGPAANTITYVPNTDYVGADSFTYTLSDGQGGTATGTVSLTVAATAVTWNPNDKYSTVTLSNGNLTMGGRGAARATASRSLGKYYYETTIVSAYENYIGLATAAADLANTVGYDPQSHGYGDNGYIWSASTNLPGVTTPFAAGDVIAVAVDLDADKVWYAKNGVWLSGGKPASGVGGYALPNAPMFPAASAYYASSNISTHTSNFGATPFVHSPPAGFRPWDGSAAPTPNGQPTAANDVMVAAPGTATALTPQANDTDPDLDALTVTAAGPASNGTVTITGGGTGVSYTSTGAYIGPDSFSYTVSDGAGGTATATVNVSVAVTWSPTDKNAYTTISNGNLTMTGTANGQAGGRATTARSTGKYYFESQLVGGPTYASIGVAKSTATLNDYIGSDVNGLGWGYSGYIYNGPTYLGNYGGMVSGQVYGVAVDLDAHKIWFSRNGAWQGGGDPSRNLGGLALPTGAFFPAATAYNGASQTGRFAPSAMSQPVPRGFAPWDGSAGPTPNGLPVAVNDSVPADRNVAKVIDPRTNDTDSDGDTLTITNASTPLHGAVVIAGNGQSVTYTPHANYGGADSFTYTISDGFGGTATATVTLSVGPNALPTAVNDNLAATAGVTATFDPRANDGDVDGDALTITAVSAAANGTATLIPGGQSVSYAPGSGFTGSDSFTYTVSDGRGGSASATVSVTVVAGVTWDPAAKNVTVVLSNGNLVMTGGEPSAGVRATLGRSSGKHYFEVRPGVIAGEFSIGISTSTSSLANHQYIGRSATSYGYRSTRYIYNAAASVATYSTYTANDVIGVAVDMTGGKAWWSKNGVWQGGGDPAAGTGGVTIAANTYFPAAAASATGTNTANFGASAFAYTMPAGFAAWQGATPAAPNSAPGAGDDSITVPAGSALTFDPRTNDTDAETNPLTITAVNAPFQGSAVVVAGGGSVTYTAPANYSGADSFKYLISDGAGGTAVATVNVTVLERVSWNPSAKNANVTLSNANLTMAAGSADVAVRATTSRSSGQHYFETTLDAVVGGSNVVGLMTGSASLANGYWVGRDAAGYGHTSSGNVVNNSTTLATYAPLASGNRVGVAVDFSAGKVWWSKNGLWNGSPSAGTGGVTLPAGSWFPAASGSAGVMMTANFGETAFASPPPRGFGSWDLRVGPAGNHAPVAANDNTQVVRNVAKTFDPRANDADADGDALTITAASTPAHGAVTVAGNGQSVTYTPDTDYLGSDSFTYTVDDGAGGTATATVDVGVIVEVVTWSPTDKGASITLTNANLTAERTSGSGAQNQVVRATKSRDSGLWYFEATATTVTSPGTGQLAVGLANLNATLATYLGSTNDGVGFYSSSGVYIGSSQIAVASTYATGDVVKIAVDATGKKAWFKVNGGLWNNNAAANPATSAGGVSLSSISGALLPAGSFGAAPPNRATANFGASAFVSAPPRGFAPWDGSAPPTPNSAPLAANDPAMAIRNTAATFNPRTNDTDADGDTLTITAVSTPTSGTAAVSGGGTTVTYTPATNYTGAATFTYTIEDGAGGSATGTVEMTVTDGRLLTVSPALAGKTTWNLEADGPMVFSTAGTWTVTPSASFTITSKLWGAGGGGGTPSRSQIANGGGGGFATASMSLVNGDSITVLVGGGGGGNGTGGAGGGGTGTSQGAYGGGGGRSEVKIGSVIQLVAGGGGGGGYDYAGAPGGGATGGRNIGDGGGGYGGTQSAGGAGGGSSTVGTNGSAGQGGNSTYFGGGGGGGYYGGGGSGTSSGYGNGGGGGSSFVGGPRVTGGSTTGGTGASPGGNGDVSYGGGAGQGGAGATSGAGAAGAAGRVVFN